MYEAIKDFNKAIDTLEQIVESITPINTEEDIRLIYFKITSETNIPLYDIAEGASYKIFISSLECILGYNRDLALKYIYKLERRLTDILLALATTFSPSQFRKIDQLFNNDNESIVARTFIDKSGENIAKLINELNEFCEIFLQEDSLKSDYYSEILKADKIIQSENSKIEEYSLKIVKDRENYERLDKLTENDAYCLAELVAFGNETNMFQVSTKELHHLIVRKRLPKHSDKIHFHGDGVRSEAYRIGRLLQLNIKQMQQAFKFDEGEIITSNNRPKGIYTTDLSIMIENLIKTYSDKNEKSIIFK